MEDVKRTREHEEQIEKYRSDHLNEAGENFRRNPMSRRSQRIDDSESICIEYYESENPKGKHVSVGEDMNRVSLHCRITKINAQ